MQNFLKGAVGCDSNFIIFIIVDFFFWEVTYGK